MLSQIIDLLKDSVTTTLGLVVSIFGATNSQVADISQTIETAVAPTTEEVVVNNTSLTDTTLEIPLVSTTTLTTNEVPTQDTETVYFERDSIKTPIFSRTDATITQDTTTTEGDLRSVNPIKTTVENKSDEVDPSLLLGTDLDKFDIELEIKEITENNDSYFIKYEYKTFLIKDNAWGVGLKNEGFSVTKGTLKDGDLENYLSKELGEIIENEILYLKEIKNLLKKKILASQQKQVSEFNNLIGKKINPQTTTATEIAIVEESESLTQQETIIETDSSDTEAPLIIIQGNNPALIQTGSSYSDLGAIVTDNITDNLGYQVGGDVVNTEVEGSYYITYTAKDEANNTATATREVIVYTEEAPTVEPITPEETEDEVPALAEPIVVEEVITAPIEDKNTATTTEEETVDNSPTTTAVLTETAGVIVNNVIEGTKQANKKVKEVAEVAVETTTTTLENVSEGVEVMTEGVSEGVEAVIEDVSEGVETVTEEISALIRQVHLLELLGNIRASLQEKAKGVGTNLQAGILNVSSVLKTSISNLSSSLPANLDNATNELLKPITKNVHSGVEALKETTVKIFQKINLNKIISQVPNGMLANISDFNENPATPVVVVEPSESGYKLPELLNLVKQEFFVVLPEKITNSFSVLTATVSKAASNTFEFFKNHRPNIKN